MAQANSFHDSSPVTQLPGTDVARPHVIWHYPDNLPLQLSSFIECRRKLGEIIQQGTDWRVLNELKAEMKS